MSITIRHIAKPVRKEINLPASKSISNRVLIIQALCEKKFRIKNLSEADDTQYLLKALQSKNKTIDAGEGGTTFRFLMAYLATQEGEWKLIGSKRLMQRPVTPLIDALKKIGASIEKKSTHYFIKGKQLPGGKLSIDAGISSQFISALLLIAPTMKNELQITLNGKIVSSSYIDMTVELMREFGIGVSVTDKMLTVTPGKYQPKDFTVEADWSAASYFY
ncbi:MAG: 3-phosphoshikimate 1-carboxyvinyltransferase, partial [Bacteroidota bacterium]